MISTYHSLGDQIRKKLLVMPHHLFVITLAEHYCINFSLFPFLCLDDGIIKGGSNQNVYGETIGTWAENRTMRGILIYKLRFGRNDRDTILPDQNNDSFLNYLGMAKEIAWRRTTPIKQKN